MSSCSGEWATAPSTPNPPALVTAATTSRQWLKARIGNSTPSISLTLVCMGPDATAPGRPAPSLSRLVRSIPSVGVRVSWVRYGEPAAEALRASVAAAKQVEVLHPVTVVVPSNYVGVATRRLLANSSEHGLVGVSFLTVYRLGELLGAARLAGSGRRPVSTPVIAAAIRAALGEDPGVFRPVATHPATETALVTAYRELRDLTAGELAAVAGAGPRAADVVRLQRRARDRLASAWYDEEDLLDGATDALRTAGTRPDLGQLIVYLPQRLTRHGATLLEAAGGGGAHVTVLAGTTGDVRADAEVVASVRRLLPGAPDPPAVVPLTIVDPLRTGFVTTSDADEEVRSAVRAVVEAARAGTRFDRMALLHASPEPYARLAHEHLAAAGIPANGAAVSPLPASLAGRTLLGALALPEAGFRRQDVFTWLAGGPILDGGRLAPVTAWERASREAGVLSGDDWDTRLTRLAAGLDAEADRAEADPDQPDWRGTRAREQAGRARSLRAFTVGLMGRLDAAAAGPRSWGQRCQWARQLLTDHLGPERRRAGWPLAEVKAAEAVDLALDRLAALDAVEGPVGLDVFTRTLTLELDAGLGRVGRFGDGVLVGRSGWASGSISTWSSCWAWRRARSRHQSTTTRFCPITNASGRPASSPCEVSRRPSAPRPAGDARRRGPASARGTSWRSAAQHRARAVALGARHRVPAGRAALVRRRPPPRRGALGRARRLVRRRVAPVELPATAQEHHLRSLLAGRTTVGDGARPRCRPRRGDGRSPAEQRVHPFRRQPGRG